MKIMKIVWRTFYFLISLSNLLLVLAEIHVRGVALSRAVLYSVNENFVCLDGKKTIKFRQVNDDFCDCEDASDEPGTSACFNGVFHCTNAGHRSKNIPSSRVNDRICDCCDSSDEYNSGISCPNNCSELGREDREREKNRLELTKKGNILKNELSNKGKSLKSERESRLSDLEKTKLDSEDIRLDKEKIKIEAEDLESEALQVYVDIQENEKREKLEKEAMENREEADENFAQLDKNADGLVDILEIQSILTFDKNRDGEVSIEEAKYFLDEHDQVDKETFVTLAWPKIKPFLMIDSGHFTAPNNIDDVTEAPALPDDSENEDLAAQDENINADHEEEEDHEEEGELEESVPHQEYDPETQQLIENANQARKEFSAADKTVREIETEIREIKDLLEKDYGLDEEFAPLDGECYKFEDREYVYSLCPFDRAAQQPRSGGSETRLGTWEAWNGRPNIYSSMLYGNGASCWNGPQRSATVSLHCGLEHKLTSVSEPNRCEYHFTFDTPAACEIKQEPLSDTHDEL